MPNPFDPNNNGLVIEQTSAASHHFELMAIHDVLKSGHDASQAVIQEAQVALDAHEAAANAYRAELDAPDFSPFVTMPQGTTVKDLPTGERLFVLPDGAFLETTAKGDYLFIDTDGQPYVVPEYNAKVVAPGGRIFEVISPRSVQDLGWVVGLPAGVNPVEVASDRFSIMFPGDLRLEVSLPDKRVVVITPTGTVLILGTEIKALGEDCDVHVLDDRSRSFGLAQSMHGGVVQANGNISLSLATGHDLVFRFPNQQGDTHDDRRFVKCGTPV